MIRFISFILFISLVGCATTNPIREEQIELVKTNSLLSKIESLQSTTIKLYKSNQITVEDSELIVEFTVSSAEVINHSVKGLTNWNKIVLQLWLNLKSNIQWETPPRELEVIWLEINSILIPE